MLSLTHLWTFITTARVMNFTQASYDLCLSQPAVSGHIAALEAELGVKLFERTGRKVVLTDAGRLVLRAALDRNSTPQTSLFKEGPRRTHFWNEK